MESWFCWPLPLPLGLLDYITPLSMQLWSSQVSCLSLVSCQLSRLIILGTPRCLPTEFVRSWACLVPECRWLARHVCILCCGVDSVGRGDDTVVKEQQSWNSRGNMSSLATHADTFSPCSVSAMLARSIWKAAVERPL